MLERERRRFEIWRAEAYPGEILEDEEEEEEKPRGDDAKTQKLSRGSIIIIIGF